MSLVTVGGGTMWVEGRGDLPGQLVVVSGPSGSGKSSVLRAVLRRNDVNARRSVSSTTRPPRPGEEHGVDYFFVDRDSFLAAIDHGEFLEWAEYSGNLYGTPARPVYESLEEGRSVILEIEVQGALQVRHHAPSALFVFVRTPTFRTLEERLRGRGTETEASTLRRLRKAREELAEAHWYDVQLVNDHFDRCVEEFASVLKSQGCGG
jgi:guanylate kinase